MASKTYVGTSVSRVIEDDLLPNSVRTGVTRALLQNGELVDHVLEEMINSIGLKAGQMYDYARGGAYVHGLPSAQFTTGEEARDQVQAVLDTIEGTPVVLDYVRYGAPNKLHIGWMKLVDAYGYVAATNELTGLSAVKGFPVYLHNMLVVIPQETSEATPPQSLEQWGVSPSAGYTPQRTTGTAVTRLMIQHSPVWIETGGASEYLRVEYVWRDATTLRQETVNIPFVGSSHDIDAEYFHAKYTVPGSNNIKYWMYLDGAGTYPTLDAVFDRSNEPNGSFFPFTYFRYNKVSEISDKTTQAYKTSKKLVKYLGMDYDQIAEAVDDNPDIADVEQAMMMFAVPANTVNELEREYLWEFFNNMYLSKPSETRFRYEEQQTITGESGESNIHIVYERKTPGIVIQDNRFKLSINNSGIYKRRVAGNIGLVGTHDSGFTTKSTSQVVADSITGVQSTIVTPKRYHYYRRQVSHGFYDEIQVVDLQTKFHIFGRYSTIGDELDDILLIPLDQSICERYSLPDRERIYTRSLHYVFNSRIVVKLKWYETGIFKIVMIIVAVIIAIYTGGAGLELLVASLGAGSYIVAVQIILTMIIEYVVMSLVFKLFIKVVGIKAAFIVAIIAAAFGMYQALEAGSLAGAPFARELLQLSTGLSKAINSEIQGDMRDLLGEAKVFEEFKEAQIKLLDTANDLLQGNSYLSPFVIFGETPQDYYNRTVHSGNIGIVGIDVVSSYVDIKLTLPKLRDSFGFGGNSI